MRETCAISHYYGTPDTELWEGAWESIKAVKGWVRQSEGLRYAMLVFVIEGCVMATCGGYHRRLRSGRMCLVPPRRAYSLLARERSHVVVCHFRPEEIALQHPRLNELMSQGGQPPAYYPSLPFNEILIRFLCLLNNYKDVGNATPELFNLKKRELFYLLYNTYSLEELEKLLGPVMGTGMNFRVVVLANYMKVHSMDELAELTNCSRAVFHHRFREVFGDSPAKWCAKRKAEHIREDTRIGLLTPQELVAKYNLSSIQHLSLFCIRHLGMGIKELYDAH